MIYDNWEHSQNAFSDAITCKRCGASVSVYLWIPSEAKSAPDVHEEWHDKVDVAIMTQSVIR